MNSLIPHPDSETLLRVVDQDLLSAEIGEHLDACRQCQDRVAALREALDDYGRFHRAVLKPSFAPPPHAWRSLEFPQASHSYFRPALWLAAAAAVAIAFVLLRLFDHAPEVRAAELLRKASAAERAAPVSRSRIRIRTHARTLEREARLAAGPPVQESATVATLHGLFDAAGYDWENPLSVEAFAQWRDRQPVKDDRIDATAGVYVVRTLAREGPLSDATLSLRAQDLHPFACTLRFRSGGEVVDMSEIPAESQPPPETTSVPSSASIPAPGEPSKGADAGDEVRVMAALHRISADLGEPIDVQRDGSRIAVRITGLNARRREEIRAALSGMPLVELHWEDPRTDGSKVPEATRATAPADRANPLISELATRSGSALSISDLGDELLEATDRAAARAFSSRALARRFPPEVASHLSPGDAATLRGIVSDHAGALVNAIQAIRRLAAPILLNSPASPAAITSAPWQSIAMGIPPPLDRLDRMLNGATDASETRKTQLAQLLADLDRQAAALQLAVGP